MDMGRALRGRPVRLMVTSWLLVALAGCLTDDGGDGADADAALADVPDTGGVDLHLQSCRVHDARFVVPAPLIEGDLPPDFTATSPDGSGATAWMGMLAMMCDEVHADGVEARAFRELRPYAVVEPPEALRDAGLDEYLLQFWNLVDHEDVMRLYDSWGHWSAHSEVAFSEDETAAGRTGMAAAEEPLWGRWELHTVVDTSTASCDETWSVGVFGLSQETLLGRVDTTFGPACRAEGVGKGVLPDMFMGEPMDAALGLVVNAALTGTGVHLVGDDLTVTQRLVPLPE